MKYNWYPGLSPWTNNYQSPSFSFLVATLCSVNGCCSFILLNKIKQLRHQTMLLSFMMSCVAQTWMLEGVKYISGRKQLISTYLYWVHWITLQKWWMTTVRPIVVASLMYTAVTQITYRGDQENRCFAFKPAAGIKHPCHNLNKKWVGVSLAPL